MAFSEIFNVAVRGVAGCIPGKETDNISSGVFGSAEDAAKFIDTTGINKIYTVNDGTTSADLCYQAAELLLERLDWPKESIDGLIFVSQTPDYRLPASSCLLQDRLGLKQDCFTLDISLGCSGWVYGLSVLSSLMSSGGIKRGLLLAGDTISVLCSPLDKSSTPLFSDAGTATALEFSENTTPLKFHFGSDGSGYNAIIVPGGGARHPVKEDMMEMKPDIDNPSLMRNDLQLYLNGMDVFSFGISKSPQSIKALISNYEIDMESVDYFILHQANGLMNNKIRKKLNLPEEKVPTSIGKYSNTSSASIPITMCSELSGKTESRLKFIACGFGVGLSWGTVYFETDKLICPAIRMV
ncbi:MAG: ketoacyl-ACP synthase III [Alistipes sp.]|nr:ketoacyl-ACP synthase III [Alistipes sp.]